LVNGVKDIVAVGTGSCRTAGKRVLAGLAVIGVVVIAGVLAAWGVSPGGARGREIAPADVIMLRFPADWMEADTTAAAPPATFALASASESSVFAPHAFDAAIMFNPNPTYVAPAAAQPSAPPVEATAGAKPEPKPAPPSKPVVVASRSLAPAHHPHARRDSGMMFNEAQLASIKARLKLSDYQEQYWPAVASALRALGARAAREPVRTATAYASEGGLGGIDPDGPEVQQLKSAAFPLIMSMNDEQKDQVRMLAHVMGLEQVASSF
jgi:hypothetical protein